MPTDMNINRQTAVFLFLPLFLSFVPCVGRELSFSAILNQTGMLSPATAVFLALGVAWLLGHGLHGAAVIAVPLFFLVRDMQAIAGSLHDDKTP